MTSRVLFAYALLLLGGYLVASGLSTGPAGRSVLVVPGICGLLVAVVVAVTPRLRERPGLRQLVLRIAATLPLIIAAALAMRAIRLGHVIASQREAEVAWHDDIERGRAAPGEAGREMYLALRNLPAESLGVPHAVLWGLAAVSVAAFLALQYDRFRDGAG